jgi:hypothetical protein
MLFMENKPMQHLHCKPCIMKLKIFSLTILMTVTGVTYGISNNGNNAFSNCVCLNSNLQGESVVEGRIVDELDEPIFGAQVTLLKENYEIIASVATDIEGEFRIQTPFEGKAKIRITNWGMVTEELPEKYDLDLVHGRTIVFNDVLIREPESIQLEKPMIYLYPEDTLAVHVEVETPGELINCYPSYEEGWKITACPDGNIIDKKGRNYYGLYWESNLSNIFSISTGTVVKQADNIAFLEEQLEKLGLNDHEANEFIVYWLPVLNKSPYNLIHFSTAVYDEKIPLHVSPQPDQLIRIMMFYKPLSQHIDVPKQIIERTKRQENGFVVVEWGGSKILDELGEQR